MIHAYFPGDEPITLSADIACEEPIYLWLSSDKSVLLYSRDLGSLLNDSRICKPLQVSTRGISFLLLSGVIPPPETIYKNVSILGVGSSVTVSTSNNSIDTQYSWGFPFSNKKRPSDVEVAPREDSILQMLFETIRHKVDTGRPTFLFHSAGKDSNSIALALFEAGWQDKVTLITHKSKGDKDESAISKDIARSLGFEHRVVADVDCLSNEHKKAIEEFFREAPFPCLDSVTMAYPLYAVQEPELKGSNIIDGMGNDVFIGHIPGAKEYRNQRLARYLRPFRMLSKRSTSTGMLHALGRSRAEHTGLSGFSIKDAKALYKDCEDVQDYWIRMDEGQDYLDLRASVRGSVLDQEMFIRKVRSFSDVYGSNLILPWANEKVANYFLGIPEHYLFSRESLKNKLLLRNMLKNKISLDSDKIGKMAFSYDNASVISNNWEWIKNHILSCSLWNAEATEKLVKNLKVESEGKGRHSLVAYGLINRLFLLSIWYNNNRYLN